MLKIAIIFLLEAVRKNFPILVSGVVIFLQSRICVADVATQCENVKFLFQMCLNFHDRGSSVHVFVKSTRPFFNGTPNLLSVHYS